jgi:hypothetical protein
MTRLLLLVLLAGSTLAGVVAAAQTPPDQKRVLVIHSTRRDSLITEAAERVLMQRLDEAFGVRLDYYTEYIDPARFPERDFSESIRRKYPDLKPDLVIAVEDAAIDFVTRYRESLLAGAPVVFFTRDATKERLPNSTGIIEPIDFARTIELVRALQPEVTQVFVISGASARDRAYEAAARAQFKPFEPQLTFTYLSGQTVPELDRHLRDLPPNSVVYPLLVSQSRDGNFKPREINARIPRMANRPTYGWHEQHLGDAYVGGSLLQLEPGLTMLAERAVRVLGGEAADGIDIGHPHLPIGRVDWRQLQRWGISEARVPAGFVVEFKDSSVWQRYRPYVIGAGAIVVVQSLLIAGLLLQARRRRQAEGELRDSQMNLTRSYERIRDVGGRLLTAQEAERSRIARELHDDIGQQMALLEFDLRESGGDGGALARLSGITRSVHDLSHRLHPTSLKFLGLVESLRSPPAGMHAIGPAGALRPQRRSRHAAAGIEVVPVPRRSRNAAECREVQRGIGSVGGVDLRQRPPDAHGRRRWSGIRCRKSLGRGLGLISIRERVEASGGDGDGGVRARPRDALHHPCACLSGASLGSSLRFNRFAPRPASTSMSGRPADARACAVSADCRPC